MVTLPSSTTPLTLFEIIGEEKTNAILAAAMQDVSVFIVVIKFACAERIVRDDPRLAEILDFLISKQLLTQQDKTDLLS